MSEATVARQIGSSPNVLSWSWKWHVNAKSELVLLSSYPSSILTDGTSQDGEEGSGRGSS